MKIFTSLSIFFLLVVSINSCQTKKQTIIVKANNDSLIEVRLETDTVNKISINKFIRPQSFFKIESPDSFYIAGPNQLIPYDAGYLFGDFKLSYLYILNKSGKIIKRIGKLGASKGKFPSLESFNIDKYNKEIIVFSNEKQALLRYDFDGDFIAEHPLDFYAYNFSILDSLHLAFFLNQNTNKVSGKNNLIVTTRDGKVVQRLCPITFLPHQVFRFTGFITQTDSAALYAEPFSDSIFTIKNNHIYPRYHLQFGDRTMPDRVKTNPKFEIINRFSYLQSPIFESEDYVVFIFFENGKRNTVVLNKLTGKAIRNKQLKSDIFFNFLDNIVGVKGNTFYSILNLGYLQSHAKIKDSMLLAIRQLDSQLYEISKNVLPFENPYIMAFQFNF